MLEFANNKQLLFTNRVMYTFALSKSCNHVKFERLFTQYFKDDIVSKETVYGTPLTKDRTGVWDTLCLY